MGIGRIWVVCLGLISALACRPSIETKNYRDGGNQSASIENFLTVNYGSQGLDAYEYTFGVLPFSFLDPSLEEGRWTLETQNYLYSQKLNVLDQGERETLSALCRDVVVSHSQEASDPAKEWSSDQSLYIQWRSHYPESSKNLIVRLAEKGVDDLRCLVTLSLEGSFGARQAKIWLDPVPTGESLIQGTRFAAEAKEAGVMLIVEADPSQTRRPTAADRLFASVGEPLIRIKVPALRRNQLKLETESQASQKCRYHMLEGKLKLGNPDVEYRQQFSIESPQPFQLETTVTQSRGGVSLAQCEKIRPQVEGMALKQGFSCADYKAIHDQGLEAGCRWAIQLSNANDPLNSLNLPLDMEKIEFETIDLGSPVGAARILPEAAKNPIRSKTTQFVNFNAQQLSSMEQAFDFWIGASQASYLEHWDNFLRRVVYEGTSSFDCADPGVLAYVPALGVTDIFWCQAAGMAPADLSEQTSPLRILLISVTAFHEVLHSRGRDHDFDAPNYQPCKGTSESALLPFDTIKTCKDDYCFAMKDFALQEYRAELDYSLEGDARRFQGLCQTWNQGLGLTAADFGT